MSEIIDIPLLLSSLRRSGKFERFSSMGHCPWPLLADAYTVSGDILASPKARQRSVYSFTNRVGPLKALGGPLANDNRMILYGVTDFCSYLTEPTTREEIDATLDFMASAYSFGGPLYFPDHLWQRVVREFGGFMPLRIEALPDGSTFWPGEPVIQVTSLADGFGELAAHIEAMMVGIVANATARATVTRHWLERMRWWVRQYNPTYSPNQVDAVARWMIHDFGMRASSTPGEANIFGRAHLLSFNGTDTFNAAFDAWMMGADRPVGTSILALAHRIVQGYAEEQDAYKAMYEATSGGVGSYVADCYDFHHAVVNYLVPLAKKGQGVVVARPDSGDSVENVEFVVQQALQNGLFTEDAQGKPIATTLRFIQGDSMTPDKVDAILKALVRLGVNPTGWGIFGVGGYLRNTASRDLFSSAYKLSAMGNDDTPVVKLSDTPAKMSVPGPNLLLRAIDLRGAETVIFPHQFDTAGADWMGLVPAYKTFYDASRYEGSESGEECFGDVCFEGFDAHRERATEEFDMHSNVEPDRHNPWSEEIIAVQNHVRAAYAR